MKNFLYQQPIVPIRELEYKRKIYLDTFKDYYYNKGNEEFRQNFDIHFELIPINSSNLYLVLASFIAHLGTNSGQHLLQLFSQQYPDQFFEQKQDYYLYIWARFNKRKFGINHGLRTIEYILGSDSKSLITLAEGEVIEKFISWLAMPEGNRYLHLCKSLCVAEHESRISTNFNHLPY